MIPSRAGLASFYAQCLSAAIALTAAATLAGWWMHSAALTSAFTDGATMKPVTAICFLAGALGVLLRCNPAFPPLAMVSERARNWAGSACGIVLLAASAWNLIQYAAGVRFASSPQMMSGATAAGVALLGLSMILFNFSARGVYPSQTLSLAACLLGLVGLQGYLFDIEDLYRVSTFSSMAVHTAMLLVLMGVGLLLANADRGWMTVLTSECLGGVLSRWLLPIVILVPVLFAWLRWRGQLAGWYGTGFGLAILSTANVSTLGYVAWRGGKWLNQMDARRRTAERELALSEERLGLALACASIGVWDYDPNTGAFHWDERCKAAFGLPENSAVDCETLSNLLHPADRRSVRNLVRASLAGRSGDFRAEYRAVGVSDGVVRSVSCRGRVLFDENGTRRKPLRFIGALQDVTVRKQNEESLIRTNQDLQQFAYAAAHDLQEPLRNIAISLSLLERQTNGRLDEDSRGLMREGVDSAQRLHRMVKDLLAYARIRQDRKPEAADTNAAVREALANLAAEIAESKTVIEAGDLPALCVESTHLVQLFQNLVGNAIKFRCQRVPHVKISAEEREGSEWTLIVEDNGIGFDPAYGERIFGIFKRLHLRHEYPGSGIGLAICSRIAALYGGSIRAEGRPHHGATFRITLPGA